MHATSRDCSESSISHKNRKGFGALLEVRKKHGSDHQVEVSTMLDSDDVRLEGLRRCLSMSSTSALNLESPSMPASEACILDKRPRTKSTCLGALCSLFLWLWPQVASDREAPREQQEQGSGLEFGREEVEGALGASAHNCSWSTGARETWKWNGWWYFCDWKCHGFGGFRF